MNRISFRSQVLFTAACLSIAAEAATAYITVLKPETCGNTNGEMQAYISGSGSVPPYTYLWSNGATTETVAGVPGGSYSVIITDAVGTPFTANATLENVDELPIQNYQSPSYASFFDLLGHTGGACEGECNGIVSMPMVQLGGTPPFTASFSVANTFLGVDNAGFPYYSGFCGEDVVSYTLADANGCEGTGVFTVVQLDDYFLPFIGDIQGACAGTAIGGFTASSQFGTANVQLFDWNGTPVGGGVYLEEFVSHTFSDLAPGFYTLDVVPMHGQCTLTMPIDIPDLGPGCTTLQGEAWFDQNADCAHDVGEVGVPGSVMVIQPGGQYAITNGYGHYSFNLPSGNYTIAQTNPTLVPYCPAAQPVPFTVNGPIANIDFANNSTAPLDLRAHISNTWARPGFSHSISGSAVNNTVQATGAVEVIMTIDPTLDLVSVTPTPTTIAGNVFTWQIAELDYFGTQGFSIQTTVPVGTPLGTVLSHSISISSSNPDADPSNDTDLGTEVVQGSYDPNDKTATTSSRASEALYFINEDDWIDYTIRFQNTGTAEAFFVTITDTLPEELDMTSFQMAVASHAHSYTFKPGRVVEWFFDDIMLPDSTTDLAGSQGFVKFRIRPMQPLLAGTVIENTANIYFDFNEPVITEPSVLVAEFSTGVAENPSTPELHLLPNPTQGLLNVQIEAVENGGGTIRLFTADGRTTVQQRLSGDRAVLDLSALTPGVYLLEWNDGNGFRVVKPVIRN